MLNITQTYLQVKIHILKHSITYYMCVSGTDVTNIKPEFSVRIVVCDHYLTRPLPGIDVIYSEFRGSDIKQVGICIAYNILLLKE